MGRIYCPGISLLRSFSHFFCCHDISHLFECIDLAKILRPTFPDLWVPAKHADDYVRYVASATYCQGNTSVSLFFLQSSITAPTNFLFCLLKFSFYLCAFPEHLSKHVSGILYQGVCYFVWYVYCIRVPNMRHYGWTLRWKNYRPRGSRCTHVVYLTRNRK